MANVSFGLDQRKNPTPSGLNFWVRVFTVSAGVILVWMPTATFIPHKVEEVVGSILGVLVALANALAPFFGLDDLGKGKVPISQVTAMDSPPDKP